MPVSFILRMAATLLPEQIREMFAQLHFQLADFHRQFRRRARWGVFVKITSEGDFVADPALALVDPGFRGKGQDFPPEIFLNILFQRHVFRIAAGGVALARLASAARLSAALFGRGIRNRIGDKRGGR